MITQSDGSEFGCCEGYEHTSNSSASAAPTSARTTLQDATRSSGYSSPAGNGSVIIVLVKQVDENDVTGSSGCVQRSFASSPQVYRVTSMGASVGSVTHSEKFTLPSPSVSNRAQASRVLLPVTLISSQFHKTVREVGRP